MQCLDRVSKPLGKPSAPPCCPFVFWPLRRGAVLRHPRPVRPSFRELSPCHAGASPEPRAVTLLPTHACCCTTLQPCTPQPWRPGARACDTAVAWPWPDHAPHTRPPIPQQATAYLLPSCCPVAVCVCCLPAHQVHNLTFPCCHRSCC
jgi:hypothetical protein